MCFLLVPSLCFSINHHYKNALRPGLSGEELGWYYIRFQIKLQGDQKEKIITTKMIHNVFLKSCWYMIHFLNALFPCNEDCLKCANHINHCKLLVGHGLLIFLFLLHGTKSNMSNIAVCKVGT